MGNFVMKESLPLLLRRTSFKMTKKLKQLFKTLQDMQQRGFFLNVYEININTNIIMIGISFLGFLIVTTLVK